MKNKSKNIKRPSSERLARLKELNARLRGQFKDFMTQDDLRKMREDDKCVALGTK